MIGSETSLWQWLWKSWKTVPRSMLDVNRVENSAGTGMPDVEGFYKTDQFWLELKVAERPKSKLTEIDVKHLRPKQVQWLHNRWLVGGNAWILLRVESTTSKSSSAYLIPGKYSRQVKAGLTEQELSGISYVPPGADQMEILLVAIGR